MSTCCDHLQKIYPPKKNDWTFSDKKKGQKTILMSVEAVIQLIFIKGRQWNY